MATAELYLTKLGSAPAAEWLAAAQSWLSDEELQRAARLKDLDVRAVHATGWALLRIAAGLSRGVDPRGVEIIKEPSGRPLILEQPPRVGSISHSGGLVAVAVMAAGKVGIDVERSGREPERMRELARRTFAPAEVNRLRSLSEAQAADETIRYWTIKEAAGKALGLSLMTALRTVVIESAGADLRLAAIPGSSPAGEWSLHQYALSDESATDTPATLTLVLSPPAAGRPALQLVTADQLRTGKL